MDTFTIRKFCPADRADVRRISCATSFLELARQKIFTDDEILADSLTLYFTDFEPHSCFVAVAGNTVIGYLLGSKDVRCMNQASGRIIARLVGKAFARGVFFRWVNVRYFYYFVRSLARREFIMPDFSAEYPAILHINIESAYRGRGIGEQLIETYMKYLAENKIKGVHFGTFSEKAKNFFLKMGFVILFEVPRTYLVPYCGRIISFYVFGKKL